MQIQHSDPISKRFCPSERAPAALAPLNEAAWHGFQDPWAALPAVLASPAQPLALRKLVSACLEAHPWDRTPDEPGGFSCTPGLPGMDGRDLTLGLARDTRTGELSFSMSSAWKVPKASRREAAVLCAQWNRAGRAVRARLEILPSLAALGRPGGAALRLHHTLPPQAGPAALASFLDACLAESADFWRQARAALHP